MLSNLDSGAIFVKAHLMNQLFTLLISALTLSCLGQVDKVSNPLDFLPEGYILFDTIYGDLNKDGIDDCLLIIKGTDKENIVINRFDEEVDRNRRGILVLLKKKDSYQLAIKNYACFASENEDGGVYFPPQLSIEINKGNLYVQYGHGRYGHWQYTFRYQNSDFELIGYDISNGGAVIDSETSINFLSKKKLKKVNTNFDAEGGDEVYEETWENIEISELIKLSEIEDFFELDMRVY
jgi:hypothetical protein